MEADARHPRAFGPEAQGLAGQAGLIGLTALGRRKQPQRIRGPPALHLHRCFSAYVGSGRRPGPPDSWFHPGRRWSSGTCPGHVRPSDAQGLPFPASTELKKAEVVDEARPHSWSLRRRGCAGDRSGPRSPAVADGAPTGSAEAVHGQAGQESVHLRRPKHGF